MSKILWMVFASNSQITEVTYTYANTEEEAREQVKDWLEQHPDHPNHMFKAYPHGCKIVHTTLRGNLEEA